MFSLVSKLFVFLKNMNAIREEHKYEFEGNCKAPVKGKRQIGERPAGGPRKGPGALWTPEGALRVYI